MTAPRALFIVGAGRAGRALDAALAAAGAPALGLHGRRADPRASAAPYTWDRLPAAAAAAGVVIVAVADRDIDPALGALAPILAAGAVVLHLSGAVEPAALGALRAAGHPCGTFHPIVPLAAARGAAEVLRGAFVGVDGDEAAIREATRLATLVGATPVRIPAGEKPRYHAAAVFASNFPVVLAAEAERLLEAAGIDGESARGIVAGLLSGAATNVRAVGPLAALTGPAVRGDVAVVRSHLHALEGDAAATDLYVTLTRAAVSLAAHDASATMLAALDGARGDR